MKPLDPFEISFSGIHLVEASAGTGKTYNITSLYIRALIELDLTVKNILVVTYTEAATKELKDRLLSRIRESVRVLKEGEVADQNDAFLVRLLGHVDNRSRAIERLQKALRTFDEASIYTIHGFCYQALQEQAFESRALFGAEMIGDDSELVLEAVDDFWRKWVREAGNDPIRRPVLQYLLDNNYSPDALASELGPHLGQPYLEIHPRNAPGVEDMEEDLRALSGLYNEMQECWQGEREHILEGLHADDLNGNKYRKSSVGGWMEQMSQFLNAEVAPIDRFKYFHKFTESTLRDSLNKGSTEPPAHPFFKLAEEYERLAGQLETVDIGFKKKLLLYLRDELWTKKEDLQVLAYDDLLLRLKEALENEESGPMLGNALREKYPLALVDEFQDTDPSQYDIFRHIYGADTGQSGLFMIGDPKQSIYSFRGADVFSYLKAKKDAPDDQVYGLGHNFRSTPGLIASINKLFGEHENPFILDEISFKAVEAGKDRGKYNTLKENGRKLPPIHFQQLSAKGEDQLSKGEAAQQPSETTAVEIKRLITACKKGGAKIGSKPVLAKDIAVLVRTHIQASQVSSALREHGIKSVQYSQESVFVSDEARELETFLKAVAEPANESLIKTALALPLTGYKAHQLLNIEEDEEQWLEIRQQFSDWHKLWVNKGFSAMFRSLLHDADIAKHLIKYQDGERRLTNILHLGELLQQEARQHKKGTRGLLKWLASKRNEGGTDRDEEQLRLESDEELVKIVTMHRSKGLEYPIVFCPFLWHGPQLSDNGQPLVYHDPDDLDKTYLDLNGKTDSDRARKRILAAREELAESLRLAYVAVTRAKQCCYLTWAHARKSEYSPLGYLLLGKKTVFESMQQTISDKYNALGGDRAEKRLKQFCSDDPGLFTVTDTPKPSGSQQLNLLESMDRPSLNRRVFKRTTPLAASYRVSSFSSLTSLMAEDPDMPDYDQFLLQDDAAEKKSAEGEERTIFSFPKGPQPGTCIHHIFEEIDFQQPVTEDNLIISELERYGIESEWEPVVSEMLEHVLEAPIHPQNHALKLSALTPDHRIAELEFYYQNKDIKTNKLLSIIREGYDEHLDYGQAASGFLKGYIDLTFQFDGKFYILDYKTNYLGDARCDYRREVLADEMREASYDLQYHIYTIALHRFLKNKLPNYSYQKHMGGAFYLFLRGMNKEGREGIYFDRPSYETIRELDAYISSGGSDE